MNETYRAEMPGGEEVVVRVARHPAPWFTDEPSVMEPARGAGVPTPRPLVVEHREDEGSLLSFWVQEFILGRSLDTLDELLLILKGADE